MRGANDVGDDDDNGQTVITGVKHRWRIDVRSRERLISYPPPEVGAASAAPA
jgi:hypothetical protein